MQDRINELKDKGWVNLSKEERKEYSLLKKENKDTRTKEENQNTNKNDEVNEEKEKSGGAILGEVFSPYLFITRVKFKGQYYDKGARVPDCSQEDIQMLFTSNLIKL